MKRSRSVLGHSPMDHGRRDASSPADRGWNGPAPRAGGRVCECIHGVILAVLASLMIATAALGQSSFVNWETPQVHPLDMTPDGSRLLAVHTADNRLEVFDVTSGRPRSVGSVQVGLDPVSVRARSDTEAWVVNHVSDSVSVIDLSAMNVVRTLRTLDEPADVVFAGDPQRAFVSCSQANTVQVFDPLNPAAPPVAVPIDAEDPRALAVSPDGLEVYAAVFESGNGTTILGGGAGPGVIGFPPNVVNDPAGPWGGVNPPPNFGDEFRPPQNPNNPPPPKVGLIVRKDDNGRWMDDNGGDWTRLVSGNLSEKSGRPRGWDLPDHDVAVIEAQSLEVRYLNRLMNLNMALAVNPVSGEVVVVGTEAINQVRYEPVVSGIFVRVHAAFVDPASGAAAVLELNPHLTYEEPRIPPEQRLRSIGDPRGIAFTADGTRALVTGKGSNSVVVIDDVGQRLAEPVPVGKGPTGVAIDDARRRAYVLNHFEGSLSVVSLETLREVGERVTFFDPTPAAIKNGRKHLYDTHRNSGHGQIACASCHVDGRLDRLAWDLGNPAGDVKPFNQNCFNGNFNDCQDWHPMKGPMMTQTLQDIIGKEPHHWRGDRDGLEEFAAAFEGLQGGDGPLPAPDMQQFEDFLATIHFPPNPFRNFDNSLPSNLPLPGHFSDGRFQNRGGLRPGDPLPNGNAQRVLTTYRLGRLDAGNISCVTCHTLPTGMGSNYFSRVGPPYSPLPPGPNGELRHHIVSMDGSTNVSIKVPQLRNLYEKVGFELTRTRNRAGFGFLHDGSVDSLARFVSEPVFTVANDQMVADLVAFMLSFSGSELPTGNANNPLELPGPTSQDTHAAVGRQVTVDGGNKNLPEVRNLILDMISLADLGKVGLVVKGVQNGQARGYAYAGNNRFQSDRLAEVVRANDLRLAAEFGAELTYTVVPAGSQTRIGIDRDEDGFFDRDELDGCSDPADPGSRPGERVLGDGDLDGDVDLADYAAFTRCFTGAEGGASAECLCGFDFNDDRRIDLADAGGFVDAMMGP